MANAKEIQQKLEDLGFDLRDPTDRKMVQYISYKKNKADFIEKFVHIEDKDTPGIVIPFNLWDAQKELLDLFIKEDRVVTLKARQLGITWLALADTAHDLIYNPGFSANTISQTEEDGKELVRRMGFIFKHMPNWLIVDKKLKNLEPEEFKKNITGLIYEQHKLKLIVHHPEDKEPAVFKAFTSAPGAARSFTASKVIMDEWAFHPAAEEIWEAAYPTFNRKSGGKVIGISTADKGTLHEEIWQNAKWEFKGEKGSGKNSFTGMFIPWYAKPERDQEWYDRTAADIPNSVKKEYPASPAEAFSAGAGAMFHEWRPDIHIPYGQEWYPPDSWRIVMAYDGGYNRAAAGWFAISPDGWAIMYREYYPFHKTDPEQAEDIRMLSRDPNGVPEQIDYIVGDTSCWAKNQDTGKTTIDIMEEHGLRPWRQADKDRIMGWRRFHEFITPIKDEQGEYVLDRNGEPLCKLRFTQSCSNTIRIFPGLKVHPQKPDDLDNGQEDHCFVAGTKISTINGKKNIEDIEIGDLVLTRKGYKPVIEANPTRKSKVIEVEFTNGRKLKATKDHRIYTKNRGFIPLDKLRYSDIIEVEENYKGDVIKWQKQKVKQLNLTALSTDDTQMQKTNLTEDIIGLQEITSKKAIPIFTGINGNITTEKYQKDIISTIKTEITSTMTLKTLNVLKEWNICQTTTKAKDKAKSIWLKCKKKLRNGIDQTKARNGIVKMLKATGKKEKKKNTFVSIAGKNLKQKHLAKLNSAQTNANQLGEENQALMMKKENAKYAEKNLQQINIHQQKLAQKNVRVSSFGKQEEKIVYNLSVAEQPEYFANGILVHNCHDMIRYYCMSRPRPKMNNKTRQKLREVRKRRIKPISSSTGY